VAEPLEAALSPGEPVRWEGVVRAPVDRLEMLVTDRRIVLEQPDRDPPWVALDIVELADHGVLLVRDYMLTMAAETPEGRVRLEVRPVVPSTFEGIDWPEAARPGIERQLAEQARMSAELRGTLGRVVAGTIVGLTLLLIVLVLVLLLT
jgi:hypothetical protein